jgi:hypothetical protein
VLPDVRPAPGTSDSLVVRAPGLAASGDIQVVSVDAGTVTSTTTARSNSVDELGVPRTVPSGRTTAPDLVAAGRVQRADGARAVVFRFDEPVAVQPGEGFWVYDPGGGRVQLTGCSTGVSPSELRCGGDAALLARATRAGVTEGAVTDAAGTYANPPSGRPL